MFRNRAKKQVFTMRGEVLDMDAMRASNEDVVAIGNGKMNARGDVLGSRGEVSVRREQIARDYYDRNPQASTQVSLKPAMPDVFESPQEAMARLTQAADQAGEKKSKPRAPKGA